MSSAVAEQMLRDYAELDEERQRQLAADAARLLDEHDEAGDVA